MLSTLSFSSINHIDKYLISRYLKAGSVGALMLFSGLFAVFVLPIIFFVNKSVFSIDLTKALFLIGVGVLSFLAIFFYFKALQQAEASVVVPFFQLTPVFGFILGFLFLGETISQKSIIAGLIIIAGVFILSFNKENMGQIVFKKQLALLMICSSFAYALYESLFKVLAIKETFWISLFWQNIGLFISALFLYFVITSYRKDFHSLLKNNGKKILGLNLINEILNTLAVGLVQYASLLAPIVLVLLVGSLQPVFVFIMGILLTLLIPKIAQEDITKKALIKKSAAIAIVLIGTYLLYF